MMVKTIDVWVHKDVYCDQGFADAAVQAIDWYMEHDVAFDMDAKVYGEDYFRGDTWDKLHNSFDNYLDSLNIDTRDNTCHVLVIDRAGPWSAGQSWNRVNGGYLDQYAGQCAVNGALKSWANECYGQGTGDIAFESTVIHEVGHTLDAEHYHGGIYQDVSGNDDAVSPMQTWYTIEDCGDNAAPSDNCTNNPSWSVELLDRSLTSCTQDVSETYVNNNYY